MKLEEVFRPYLKRGPCLGAINYGTNMTFEDTKDIISMKDRTEVRIWTDWWYNEIHK